MILMNLIKQKNIEENQTKIIKRFKRFYFEKIIYIIKMILKHEDSDIVNHEYNLKQIENLNFKLKIID